MISPNVYGTARHQIRSFVYLVLFNVRPVSILLYGTNHILGVSLHGLRVSLYALRLGRRTSGTRVSIHSGMSLNRVILSFHSSKASLRPPELQDESQFFQGASVFP
jgi:hypothetical protein